MRSVVIGEVELFQDEALSVDLRIFPLCPIATNVLFPKVTPLRVVEIPEVELFQDEPLSVDLAVFPPSLTATKVLFPKVTPLLVPT